MGLYCVWYTDVSDACFGECGSSNKNNTLQKSAALCIETNRFIWMGPKKNPEIAARSKTTHDYMSFQIFSFFIVLFLKIIIHVLQSWFFYDHGDDWLWMISTKMYKVCSLLNSFLHISFIYWISSLVLWGFFDFFFSSLKIIYDCR